MSRERAEENFEFSARERLKTIAMEALTQETSGTETAFIGKNIPFRARVLSFVSCTRTFVSRKKCSEERRKSSESQPTYPKPPKKWLCGDQRIWSARLLLINMAVHVAISVTNSL